MAELSLPFLATNEEGIPSGCPQGNLYRGHRIKVSLMSDHEPYDMEIIEESIGVVVRPAKEQRGDE